jgi:hypothetical protein
MATCMQVLTTTPPPLPHRFALGSTWYMQRWPRAMSPTAAAAAAAAVSSTVSSTVSAAAAGRAMGMDGSGTYIHSPDAALRLPATLSATTTALLLVLRDPTARAVRRLRELMRRGKQSMSDAAGDRVDQRAVVGEGGLAAKLLFETDALSTCFEAAMDSAMDAEPLPSPPPPSPVDQAQLGQGPQAIHTPVHRQLGQAPQAPRRRRGRGGNGMAPATEQAAAAAAWRRRLNSPQLQPVNGSVNGQQQLLLPQASPARGPAAPTGRTLTAKAWARCVATVCGSRACMSGTGVDHPSCMQVLTTTPLPLPHRYGRLSPPAGRMGKGGGPLPLDGAARRSAAHARVRWPRAHLRLARAAAAPRDALPRRAAAGMAHCQPRQDQREQSDGARDDARS